MQTKSYVSIIYVTPATHTHFYSNQDIAPMLFYCCNIVAAMGHYWANIG